MLDSAQPFLLLEVIHDTPLGVEVHFHGLFVNIVQQIEVEILHTALFQLLLEYLSRVVAGADDLVSGIFGGKEIAFPGIFTEDPTDNSFGFAAVIGIGGVKIVYTMLNGIGGHFCNASFIDAAVRMGGQSHGAEAQPG